MAYSYLVIFVGRLFLVPDAVIRACNIRDSVTDPQSIGCRGAYMNVPQFIVNGKSIGSLSVGLTECSVTEQQQQPPMVGPHPTSHKHPTQNHWPLKYMCVGPTRCQWLCSLSHYVYA